MANEEYLQYGDNLAHSKGELNDMEKGMKFDIDDTFAKKIDSFKIDPNDEWGKAIKKACFTKDKWYIRFWKWVKGLFGCKPKNVYTRPADVEMNEEFDFQKWVLEKNDKIIEAIKKDGKDSNEIICPVCYKTREYYLAPGNKHIHSNCNGCGIRITQ